VLVAVALVGVLAPSLFIHPDALDELYRCDVGGPHRTVGHPLVEPIVCSLVGLVPLESLRVVQLWNLVWVVVALGGVWRVVGMGTDRLRAPSVVGLLAFSYAGLHLARDPYLPDWPPALALLSWGVALRERSFLVACLLVGAAGCFVPPALAGLLVLVADEIRVRKRSVLAGVVVALVPPAVAICAALGHPDAGSARPAGLSVALKGALGALTAQEQGFSAFGLVDTPLSPAAWATAGAIVGFGVWLAVFVRAAFVARDPRGLSALVSAGVVGAFLLAWGPDQARFWLLPLWLLALGSARLDSWWLSAVGAGAAACLFAANGARYVLPTSSGPDPRVVQARTLASEFASTDLLLFADGPRPHVDYFGGLQSDGLEVTLGRRDPGLACTEYLELLAAESHRNGGVVYVLGFKEVPGCLVPVWPLLAQPGKLVAGMEARAVRAR